MSCRPGTSRYSQMLEDSIPGPIEIRQCLNRRCCQSGYLLQITGCWAASPQHSIPGPTRWHHHLLAVRSIRLLHCRWLACGLVRRLGWAPLPRHQSSGHDFRGPIRESSCSCTTACLGTCTRFLMVCCLTHMCICVHHLTLLMALDCHAHPLSCVCLITGLAAPCDAMPAESEAAQNIVLLSQPPCCMLCHAICLCTMPHSLIGCILTLLLNTSTNMTDLACLIQAHHCKQRSSAVLWGCALPPKVPKYF